MAQEMGIINSVQPPIQMKYVFITRVLSTGGGGGWGEGSTPNSTSSPQKFLNKKLLKVHKCVNYACTHNFKYST